MSERILTCTWAPTVLDVPKLVAGFDPGLREVFDGKSGEDVTPLLLGAVQYAESLGIDLLLVAQRWYGSGAEVEGSTFDALAMTAFYAAHTKRIKLVTAIHPGFFLPGPIAKWGATIDRLTGGRWAINVTSGWNLAEFDMFGAERVSHDERYARSAEFIRILRGAWAETSFDFAGDYYTVDGLRIEPRPASRALEVFQGGQSPAAIEMAAEHSDWMFLNGGPPEKIARIIKEVSARAADRGRRVRFALYAVPLVRESNAEAEDAIAAMVDAIDPAMIEARRGRLRGAEGMWSSPEDPLTCLDTNEGYASRLIGSPDRVCERVREFVSIGVECLHFALGDALFASEVLPKVGASGG